MITELKIAKHNVHKRIYALDRLDVCKEHKATCERWLEYIGDTETYYSDGEKKKDLKATIALYKENGT